MHFFRIKSNNTCRTYIGETYFEDDNPLKQRIHLEDPFRSDILMEVELTENEFKSNATFCKGISKTIYDNSCDYFEMDSFLTERDSIREDAMFGPVVLHDINPSLLKALVG